MDYEGSPEQQGPGELQEEGSPSYMQSKIARKKAEEDAKLLMTRIALLKKQEQKAWKKIEETKKRAKEILELRVRNQEKTRQIEERKKKQEDDLNKKKQFNQLYQKSIKDTIHHNKREVENSKREGAKTLKENKYVSQNQPQQQKKFVLFQKQQELLKNSALCATIKKQEKDKAERMQNEAQQKAEQARLEVMKRIEDQNRERNELENKVQKMEQEELDLIQKLQNTQLLQKAAYEDLEKALMSPNTTPSTFDSSGGKTQLQQSP